ncbi:MAG TPA: outer membrane beta-barrel protein [Allosphingosinicella sp.]|nr:outer membrane beta-barrel protein [Allosphingosinicella sp.]
MNPKIIFAAAVTAATIVSSPAAAQTGGEWSGVYAGGRIGYAFQPNDDDETILFDTDLNGQFDNNVTTAAGANAFSPGFCGGAAQGATPGAGCEDDEDGVDFAIHGGVDGQFGNFVLGGLVEYGRTDIRDSVSAFSTTPAFYTMTRRLRDNASLRGRAGVAFGQTLAYATGGVAWGRIRNSFATNNAVNTFVQRGDDDAWGYRVGGGVEHMIAPRMSVGLQYLYTSLDDDETRVRAQGPAPATNPFIRTNAAGTDFARSGDRFNWHSVNAALSFRF